MLLNLDMSRILWILTFALACAAAVMGIVVPGLYENLFPADFIPGAMPQDILTALACAASIILVVTTGKTNIRRQIVILGAIGSLLYLYGIFTMERVYNAFYLLYAAIFSLAFWSLAYSLANMDKEVLPRVTLPRGMRITSATASMVIALLFTFLWVSALIPLMREHRRVEYLYSIYILDLCLVMPALVMTAIMGLRKKPLGMLLAPAMFIMGFFVIFPLALNEAAKPSYGQNMSAGRLTASLCLSALFLVLAFLHLGLLRVSPAAAGSAVHGKRAAERQVRTGRSARVRHG
jgi:hypothetical protein